MSNGESDQIQTPNSQYLKPNTYTDSRLTTHDSRFNSFNEENFHWICDSICKKDRDLKNIFTRFGYPPMWRRPASFQTLIHIILEQQVSLASARSALNKLKEKIGRITPRKILLLSDSEMRACYFSRQKTIYARQLAEAILSKQLVLKKFNDLHDDNIREELKRIKGIGDWTADIYLLFGLQRADVFPIGDLAMVNALKEVKKLNKNSSRENILQLAENWKPYRSIATMMLWHYYLEKRKPGR